MGNFHCIPSDCARIVWREYLPAVIRWRYPDENWQEIEGDDYAIERETPRFIGDPKKRYFIVAKLINLKRVPNDPPWGGLVTKYSAGQKFAMRTVGSYPTPIWSTELSFKDSTLYIKIVYTRKYFGVCEITTTEQIFYAVDGDTLKGVVSTNSRSFDKPQTNLESIFDLDIEEQVGAVSDECPYEPGDCTFKIFAKGNIVHEETRDVCPEVEKIPCRLDDVFQEIKIEKEAYLQRIEVRNQSIETIFVESPLIEVPLIDINKLSDECLNIYNTYTLAPPILSNYVPIPGVINPYQFIQQICSAPGCPRPEFEVICDCNCEKCPDGTCAVNCGDHVCCYDITTGTALLEIPIENYCGDIN